jgi:hypothetical protein
VFFYSFCNITIKQWVLQFYAIWVGKFLSFLNLNRHIKEKSTLPTFIEQLKNQGNVKDWHHVGAPICTALGIFYISNSISNPK